MNIGSLYLVKKYFWMLFPTRETAPTARSASHTDATVAAGEADFWSECFNCEVTYFSPNEHIVFLEEEDKFKKVLTSDGRIGWTWVHENYNDYFEEVKEE